LPELGENVTIDDYVVYALLNNPGVRGGEGSQSSL